MRRSPVCRARSVVDVAGAAIGVVSDLLVELKGLAVAMADDGLDDASKRALKAQYNALYDQMRTTIGEASFGGANMLDGSLTEYAPLGFDTPIKAYNLLGALTGAGVSGGGGAGITEPVNGNLTGTTFGDVDAPINGNLSGVVVGDVNDNVSGNLTGTVFGSVTGTINHNINGTVTGDLIGNVNGEITGSGVIGGDVVGTVNGNISGDVYGDIVGVVTGNISGTVYGRILGTVNGSISGTVHNGAVAPPSLPSAPTPPGGFEDLGGLIPGGSDGLALPGGTPGSAEFIALIGEIEQMLNAVNTIGASLGTASRQIDIVYDLEGANADRADKHRGLLVDADLGRASAALEAQNVREQLALQALQISNASPRIVLSLFAA